MAVYKQFITDLNTFLVNTPTKSVKMTIGDSINNNRTLTVNQVIRFLTTRRNVGLNNLGFQLEVAYEGLLGELHAARTDINRTDAFDINEFVNVYTDVVLNGNGKVKRTFSRIINAA